MKLNYFSIIDFLNAKFIPGSKIKEKSLAITTRPENLYDLFSFIKSSWVCKYDILMDITAIHYSSSIMRENHLSEFSVIYNLLSTDYNQRLTVECLLTNSLEYVPSITSLFPCASWYERETYDMFGILFYGNKDMRRILTDYGFEGFPLRKDFPISGYLEARFCEKSKRVVLENLSLSQANRTFEFESPWR